MKKRELCIKEVPAGWFGAERQAVARQGLMPPVATVHPSVGPVRIMFAVAPELSPVPTRQGRG